jgi:hypothetical protein
MRIWVDTRCRSVAGGQWPVRALTHCMDSAEQLARLYAAGFEIQTFERYPRAVGVMRYGAIALVEPTPEGLRMVGTPGWRMGEVMGVLVEESGQRVFRAKAEVVEATPGRLEAVSKLRRELEEVLAARA